MTNEPLDSEFEPWVAIQRNPTSGSGRGNRLIIDLIAELRRLNIRPRLFSNRERMQRWLAAEHGRQPPLCLVAAGGDGTVCDLVNRYPLMPIAILPLGTENLLARYLGIGRSGRDVARMIAENRQRQFDTGLANGKRFLIMASLGFDADVIHRMQAYRRGHITRWSYVRLIWDAIRAFRHPEMSIYVDGSPTPLTGRLAVITNVPMYALQLPIARSAIGDDGLLDLHLFREGSLFQLVRYLYHIVRGSHERLPDVIHVTGREFRIECEELLPIQIDGDAAGTTPVTIAVEPQSCVLLTPP
ncbi:MAG: diacylglycerol kinase family protein [Planctomycetaceae bacterium]